MLQSKIVKETAKKYIKLKGFDAEFNKRKADLIKYCVDYIKNTIPQEIQDLAASKTPSVLYQQDLNFYYWNVQKMPGVTTVKFNLADKYFDIRDFGFKKYSLPRFFEAEDLTRDNDNNKEFRKTYKEFTKTFIQKYLDLIDYAYEVAQKVQALESVLLNEKATLTTIKANYKELYNLIKS